MSDPESDIYVYKMTADSGGAPCVIGRLLSLAICKPRIRKSAREGSFIFGFGGKEYQERLIYIACVTRRLEGQDYYRRREYAARPDCIYRVEDGRAVRKASARYHVESDERRKDVGVCFENAFVLLSEDFRYLGKLGRDDYKQRYPKIRSMIEALTQGERRFHSSQLRAELFKLKAEVWKSHSRMTVGTPSDDDYRRLCNSASPGASC
jgi:hypothetical protein